MPEEYDDEPEGLDKPPSFFPYDEENPERTPGNLGEPVEVTVEGVFVATSNGIVQRFVLLANGDRKVPILIGPFEATSISMCLEGSTPDRPITHDLMKTIIDRLGADVDRIVIDDLWSTTYYAKIYLRKDEEEMEIDSRPSDAIAIAVRCEAPIFVAEGILEQGFEA